MISTHILDTHKGCPAAAVKVVLELQSGKEWKNLATAVTNNDGRIKFELDIEAGVYRLNFEVDDYFKKNSQETFFSQIPIVFHITNTKRDYHVPLLLNNFGYTTYRGS